MGSMFCGILGIDEYNIDKDNDILVKYGFEDFVHKIKKEFRSIGQSERYNCKLILAIPTSKCCLGNVNISNP